MKRFFMRNKNKILSIYQPENYGIIMKIVEPDTLSVLIYKNGRPTNYLRRVRLKNIQFLQEIMKKLNKVLIGKVCAFENIIIDSFGITTADVFVESRNLVEYLKTNIYAI
jgi:hypothetical protein